VKHVLWVTVSHHNTPLALSRGNTHTHATARTTPSDRRQRAVVQHRFHVDARQSVLQACARFGARNSADCAHVVRVASCGCGCGGLAACTGGTTRQRAVESTQHHSRVSLVGRVGRGAVDVAERRARETVGRRAGHAAGAH
jgi:hypothetical protein